MELCKLTAIEASEFIRNGKITASEYMAECVGQIRKKDPDIHAWAFFDEERAMDLAKEIDIRVGRGDANGALCGIPVGIKDVFNTVDMPTCMGSPIWKDFTPGNDARVVSYIKWADGLVMGKTATAEFAVHAPPPTVNPYNPDHTPGTSSSGSAAAVATHMVPVALGTQTAGSTIRPASYCGIFGYKPTFGLIPRTGILKTLDTLDHVSCLSRSVEDLRLMLDVLRVKGENFPFVYNQVDLKLREPQKKKSWRIGFVKTHVWSDAESYAQQAITDYASALSAHPQLEIEEITLPPSLKGAHQLHDKIYTKALSYYFHDEVTRFPDKISDWFMEMVEAGRKVDHSEYMTGLRKQTEMIGALDRFFENLDAVLSLSTAGEAPKGLHATSKSDPCLIWTLCHVPVVHAPLFEGPNRLPFGVQFVARRYHDYPLFDLVDTLNNWDLLPLWKGLRR